MKQIHTTAETAHLTFDYPFGRSVRCVRREFLEFKPRTGFRFVTQTTEKRFNGEYTDKIAIEGLEAANAWAFAEIGSGRVRWNAAKPSTYVDLAVMVEKPLEDGSGRIGTGWEVMRAYDEPTEIVAFFQKHGDEFNTEQRGTYRAIERASRRHYAEKWEAIDADGPKTPDGFKAYLRAKYPLEQIAGIANGETVGYGYAEARELAAEIVAEEAKRAERKAAEDANGGPRTELTASEIAKVAKFREIVEKHTAKSIDGAKIDALSAQAVVVVIEGLEKAGNAANLVKFVSQPARAMVSVAFRLVKIG